MKKSSFLVSDASYHRRNLRITNFLCILCDLSTDDADYADDQKKTYRGRIAELQAWYLSNLTSKELIELNDDGCSLIRVGL